MGLKHIFQLKISLIIKVFCSWNTGRKYFYYAFLYLILIISSCSETKGTKDEFNSSKVGTKMVEVEKSKKILLFNKVDILVKILSQNGIGKLKEWENPMDMGYGSLTDYYSIGNPKSDFGLANNIAYYLEGTENTAGNLLITLNVNNDLEKQKALVYLSRLSARTFKSLNLEIPKGLLKAIKTGKEFQADNAIFFTSFKLKKSNIETWKMSIESK